MIESLALPGESYKLAFTPGLLTKVYGARVTDAMVANDGGYVHSEEDANWWIPSGRVFYSPQATDTPAQELAFAQHHFFLPRRSLDPFGNTAVMGYDAYDFLVTHTIDPLSNTTTADYEYRLLQPFRLTDPNGNRAEVAFDTLGLVAGTAVMGKTTETKGDTLAGFVPNLTPQQRQDFLADPLGQAALLLGQATTRIVYDLDQYLTTQQPVFAATLARETHVSDLAQGAQTKVQLSFSYSDGFGREIQKKIQAEPGPVPTRDVNGKIIVGADGQPKMTPNDVSPRWVGSGWTVFNNKGKPIRQYEPFFTDTHHFEFDVRIGVSPVLFYDPVERVVATLHPNHTWEKVVFDPWRQESWDVNDTVLIADPKTDPEVGAFFQRLPEAEYRPTWYEARKDGQAGTEEKDAATKTAIQAATPSVSYTDSLGRTVLTVAHNKFERNGVMVEEKYATRIMFDIEGNQRAVIDAKDRVVMRYDYDVLGTRIHQASMEAGERWMLSDATGKPIYAWDSRDHQFRTAYDQLRRPIEAALREGTGSARLIGRMVYGETQPNPEANNLRGKVVQVFDQAGVVTTTDYDFKGNLLAGRRQLAKNYKTTLDWSANPELETEIFTSSSTYDALNRPISATSPDGSVYRPTFNEANLLEKVEVNLRGASTPTTFVTNIDYDAKGQRVLIEYGNNVKTEYRYDPLTFRLSDLKTTRLTDHALMQGLSYTYDPAGNVTQIRDGAQQTIYFNNQVVMPHCDYTYDAIYRLINAEGREHIGQVSQPETTWNDEFRVKLQHPQDGQAMRRYTERYEYDPVGNFERMIHQATNGNWTRTYAYNEASLLEPGKPSNRLSSTVVGRTTGHLPPEMYPYDAHGNMLAMAHLPRLDWDFEDQLRHVNLGGGGEAYYVYDAGDQRIRKIVEKNGGTLIEERIYLSGFEVFRQHNGAGTVTLERETLHVMDDKQRIALIETKTKDTSQPPIPNPQPLFRYQFGNHLGSASLESDGAGQIISYEEYYPYGSTSYQAGRSAVEVSLKRYRYTGMERDEESGLNYHSSRYYAPWLGRWMSCDPAELVDSINMYVFCRNSPTNWIDDDGWAPDKPEVIEAALRSERGTLEKLGKEQANLLVQKGEQEVNVSTRAADVGLAQHGLEAAQTGQLKRGERKALQEGSGTRNEIKALERAEKKLAEAKAALEKTNERLKSLDKQIQTSKQVIGKLVKKAQKIGANVHAAPDDPKVTEEHLAAVDEDVLSSKFTDLENAADPIKKTGPKIKGSMSDSGLTSGKAFTGTLGAVAVSVGIAALQSHNAKEFAANSALNMAATRYPPLAAATASNEGEAGAAILMMHVASKFPLTAALIGVGAGIYAGGMALKPKKMSAPGIGSDQSWAKPWFEGGTRSGCGTCHESVRIDNAYKSSPLLRNWERLNGPASRDGIVTDQAREFYMRNAGF